MHYIGFVYLGYDVCGYVEMCITYASYKIWDVHTRVLHCCMVVACMDRESNTVCARIKEEGRKQS